MAAAPQDRILPRASQAIDVDASFRETIRLNGIRVPGFRRPESLMDFIRVDMSQVDQITLMTLNPNLGDNIIDQYGMISYIHEKYPNAVIRVMSPTSSLLRESDWLKPVTLPTAEFYDPKVAKKIAQKPELIVEKLKPFFESQQGEGAVVIWDDSTFDRLAREVGAAIFKNTGEVPDPDEQAAIKKAAQAARDQWAAEIKSLGSVGIGFPGSPHSTIVVHDEFGEPLGKPVPGKKGLYQVTPIPVGFQPQPTIYENMAARNQLLFGKDLYFAWEPSHYLDAQAMKEPYEQLLKASFKDPERPTVVLNLNTRGEFKVKDLRRDYAKRVDELVGNILERYPEVNIFLSAPEDHYGPEVVKSVSDVIGRYTKKRGKLAGRVALLPEDKALWKPILKEAAAVVSQDSGFVHVANLFNPNVLTISRDIVPEPGSMDTPYVGSAQRWRKPRQVAGSFSEVGEPGTHAPVVFSYLDGVLGCSRKFAELSGK